MQFADKSTSNIEFALFNFAVKHNFLMQNKISMNFHVEDDDDDDDDDEDADDDDDDDDDYLVRW